MMRILLSSLQETYKFSNILHGFETFHDFFPTFSYCYSTWYDRTWYSNCSFGLQKTHTPVRVLGAYLESRMLRYRMYKYDFRNSEFFARELNGVRKHFELRLLDTRHPYGNDIVQGARLALQFSVVCYLSSLIPFHPCSITYTTTCRQWPL